ncbi:response regulator transcription factor [Chloroflexota bacterium]
MMNSALSLEFLSNRNALRVESTLASPAGYGVLKRSRLPDKVTEKKLDDGLSDKKEEIPIQKTRVLIVDDSAVVRDGLCSVIGAQSDIEIVGDAGNGLEAIAKAEKLYPNVILMDVRMPEMDGVEATRHIKRHLPDTKVLLLTAHDDHANEALTAGVSHYLTKDCRREDLLSAIRRLGRSSLRGCALNEVTT